MRATVLDAPGRPLRTAELPEPEPGPGQIKVRVHACGVCRTDLHVRDGEVAAGHLPLVLGHQIVGTDVASGRRLGIPWLGWTDGTCRYCASGRENLCEHARFTGKDIDGGYAEYAVADERFCFPLPGDLTDLEVAPLLCGGLIGYRALRLADQSLRGLVSADRFADSPGRAERLGLYGFGSAAHIICQVAVHQGRRVFAFVRGGDDPAADLARSLGAEWAGPSDAPGPEPLDAAIIFAPAGPLVPAALRATAPGGVVVCAGIHMSDIPSVPYSILWEERVLRSVANLTREDAREFLALAPRVPVRTTVHPYSLEHAEEALRALRAGEIEGSAVIRVREG